jgi:hypothetical protein
VRQVALDLLGLSGLGMTAGGVWWVYPPAALIVAGLALSAYAVIATKRSRG